MIESIVHVNSFMQLCCAKYKLLKLFPFIFLFLLFPLWASAQFKVEGFIFDRETNLPIHQVELEIHETEQTCLTNLLGGFTLSLQKGNYHLHLLASGYEANDLDITIGKDTTFTIFLKPTFLELKEVLIEESSLKSIQRNSSLDVERINYNDAEKSIESSLAESLKKTPGIEAYNTGVGIAKPIIRGFTATRVSVYDQGVKQEGQQWGMDHGLEIDPFNVDRVEVIKGPGALQYGSDAIGGVVKLLPEALPDVGLKGSYTSLFKSNNNHFGNSIKLSFRKGDHFISGRLSHQQYEDFKVPADEFTYNGFTLPVVDNTLKNTAGNLISYRMTYGIHKRNYNLRFNASRYKQKVGIYSGAIGIPRAFDVGNIGSLSDIDVPYQNIVHTKLSGNLNARIGQNWLTTNIGYQYNEREEHSRPESHGLIRIEDGNTLSLALDLHTLSHNSRYNWKSKNLKYSLGIDQQFQRNFKSGWEYLIPDFASFRSGAFGLVEGKYNEQLNWNAGIRFDYGSIQSDQHLQPYFNDLDSLIERSPSIDRQFLNYALGYGLTFNPSEQWNVKLNLAKSFRMPVTAELASNGVHHGTFRHEVGNPDLDSEEGLQTDLGITYLQKDLYVKLTPFFNYFSNYIYLRPTGSFSSLPDAGQLYAYSQTEALHTGTEFFIEYHPIRSLHISSGMEYVHNLNLETNLPLPFTPPFSNLFSVEYDVMKSKKLSWDITAEHRWAAAQNRTDRNELSTPSYQVFNFKTKVHFNLFSTKMSFGASILNAFNTAYLSHLSRYRILNLPEQGRNIVLNLNIQI